MLGQLVVTPEVVASKISNVKENKSPGVDARAPKVLKETVEQISTQHAHVITARGHCTLSIERSKRNSFS